MKKAKDFPFEAARRVTAREVQTARKALEEKLEARRRGVGYQTVINETLIKASA